VGTNNDEDETILTTTTFPRAHPGSSATDRCGRQRRRGGGGRLDILCPGTLLDRSMVALDLRDMFTLGGGVQIDAQRGQQ